MPTLPQLTLANGRIPYGMRGLKCLDVDRQIFETASHPIRDAWIEIIYYLNDLDLKPCRIPYGMRGLKLVELVHGLVGGQSHPIRDAWIEIPMQGYGRRLEYVASHTGCVD